MKKSILSVFLAGMAVLAVRAVPVASSPAEPETFRPTVKVGLAKELTLKNAMDSKLWDKMPKYALMHYVTELAHISKAPAEGAYVRYLYNDTDFFVRVDMVDSDVMTGAFQNQDHHYIQGDLIEVFIKPQNDSYYWEIYGLPNKFFTRFYFPSKGTLSLPSGFGPTDVKIGVDSKGMLDLEELEREVDEKTVLVSIMAVNNEVGTIEPFGEIKNIVKRKNSPALFHIDAVQAFGKLPLNVKKIGADLMSVSSHKIHGPKGVGALFIKNGTKLSPRIFGGGQEKDIRPGTEPMPAIAGFAGAVEELNIRNSLEKMTALRDEFVNDLRAIDGVIINSPDDALPYIVNVSLSGLRSETVLNLMSQMGIYVSSGSACAKGHKSHVLTAMGLDDSIIDSSLRVSLSRFTTKEELQYFIEGVNKALTTIMKR